MMIFYRHKILFFLFFSCLYVQMHAQGKQSTVADSTITLIHVIQNVEASLLQDIRHQQMPAIYCKEVIDQEEYSATILLDSIIHNIQLLSTLSDSDKQIYLKSVMDLLQMFNANNVDKVDLDKLPSVLATYQECLWLLMNGKSYTSYLQQQPVDIASVIIANPVFNHSPGIFNYRAFLLLQQCILYPQKQMAILRKNPSVYFADSLLSVIARTNPNSIYDYAMGGGELSDKIQYSHDFLLRLIYKLANMPQGRWYIPFLDPLYQHRLSIETVTKAINSPSMYYNLLVKTRINFVQRMIVGDTPLLVQTELNWLARKGNEDFISKVNQLHNQPASIRFACLNYLSVPALYYLTVLSEDEIYTSSFLQGIYPRLFQHFRKSAYDSIFIQVDYDHFKKWIKICANYNKLGDFIAHCKPATGAQILSLFVSGLGTGTENKDIEDAVDIATTFASISSDYMQNYLLGQIKYNFDQMEMAHNQRGSQMYDLLYHIFLSKNPASNIDLNQLYHITPIYQLDYSAIKNVQGTIPIVQFFYGDLDGRNNFKVFMDTYKKDTRWHIEDGNDWVEISSLEGVPIVIYANKPLNDSLDLDTKAQNHLMSYLYNQQIYPTIVIHRGHSYFLPNTISLLPSSAKLLILGSCGSYHNLNDALLKSPGAQIISSKQIGVGIVNQEIINFILSSLLKQNVINWVPLWNDLGKIFKQNKYAYETFEDYVPPYQNLGAIFIMAYKQLNGYQSLQ